MRRTHALGFAPVTCATIALLMLIRFVAFAQDVTGPSLKAAYIYNFVKFTEWPGRMPASEPFVMCVIGDTAVGDALERAVVGRVLAGHSIVVSRLLPDAPKQACHVVYVSGVTGSQAVQLVAGLRDAPVLTISDIEGFAGVGGIAQFFFEHGKLRFRIHLEAAKRAGLQISSRLLAMAETI